MKTLSALIAGLLFGFGLALSGMANPAKVQNFLDIAGTWDPSLAFVMGGAILVTAPGYWLLRKRTQPLFASNFQWPTKTEFDFPLIAGATSFGVGWGLGGFCPGPALAAVPMMAQGTIVFVITMIIGMWLANLAKNRGEALASV